MGRRRRPDKDPVGKIFSDGTPATDKAFVERRRKETFLALADPHWWQVDALQHKHAADHLYEFGVSASIREFGRIEEHMKRGPGSYEIVGEELEDFKDRRMIKQYALLMGYAFECLLKGLWILKAKDGKLVDDAGKLLFSTHDLPFIAGQCGISLSEEEDGLLFYLYQCIDWRKYPVPKTYGYLPSQVDSTDPLIPKLSSGSAFVNRSMQQHVDALFSRIDSEFESEQSRQASVSQA